MVMVMLVVLVRVSFEMTHTHFKCIMRAESASRKCESTQKYVRNAYLTLPFALVLMMR